MNPPSALHGAMSRDRKPFTYTPGGLDLSEIKSERMAKRLMRNAMNQGVPDTPAHSVHSQSNTSAPVALPNYNCLPVQVFPTFNLPANPKSLLRTRSDPRETPIQRIVPSTVNSTKVDNNDTFNNNNKYTPTYSQVNNNRPVSMYEYNTQSQPAPVNTYSLPRVNYGSDGYAAPVLPEISYEAEYFSTPPKLYSASEQLPKLQISEERDKVPVNESVNSDLELTIKPLTAVTISTSVPAPVATKDVLIPTMVTTPVVPNDVIMPNISAAPVVANDIVIPTFVTTPVATNDVVIPIVVPTPIVKDVTIQSISSPPVVTEDVSIPPEYATPVLTKPVEENAGTENEQVQLKLLYIYYAFIYMSVYIVCYTYLQYNITEL